MVDNNTAEPKTKSPFGAYDIRGVYGETITEAFAYSLGIALSTHLGKGKLIAVGHDSRLSSPSLTQALISGIEAAGNRVEGLGLASTPRVYWHGSQKQFAGSVAITASHLPAKHNGFKICREQGIPISSEDGLKEIQNSMERNQKQDLTLATKKHEQAFESHGLAEYLDLLRAFLKLEKPLKIVIDIGGSPVGEEISALLIDDLLTVELMDSAPDGNFSRRSPNPMDEGALDDLCNRVRESQADFGVAFDGDGDRIVFINETGKTVSPDLVTALLAMRVLQKTPGAKIMYDLRSSRAVPEFIITHGGLALKCRVGHSFIKADMRRKNAALAGELSSHYYWAELAYTDNAVKTLIEIINLLSQQKQSLAQLVAPLDVYPNSGEINFACKDVRNTLEALHKNFADAQFDFTDGITAEFSNWWFNARGSHTEPLLRLCIGAQNQELLIEKKMALKELIEETNSNIHS
ncbi:MAG: phosphomannomutase/phosphoglucomutase [Candidatus Obscuribacterales bacterium]|nr:phosphomannomutase/phosphoglucomutase [Candidatus Obscuribacterales bacterium]